MSSIVIKVLCEVVVDYATCQSKNILHYNLIQLVDQCCQFDFSSYLAEYRTVSGVAGPLVILEKVKVGDYKLSHASILHPFSYNYTVLEEEGTI